MHKEEDLSYGDQLRQLDNRQLTDISPDQLDISQLQQLKQEFLRRLALEKATIRRLRLERVGLVLKRDMLLAMLIASLTTRTLKTLGMAVWSLPKYFTSWPRAWQLFSMFLDRRTRERVWDPCYNELLDQYLDCCRDKRLSTRCWINAAFLFKSLIMGTQCVATMILHRCSSAVPDPLKRWWFS